MNVTFACPDCQRASRIDLHLPPDDRCQTAGDTPVREPLSLHCAHCGTHITPPPGAVREASLTRCLVCPSRELFVRKDFPQRLGVAIVVLGFAASCITWYNYWTILTFAILFATALADLVLYKLVGDALVCYRCGAEYRQAPATGEHGPFELETHERYRQQAARLAGEGSLRIGQAARPRAGQTPS